MSYQKYLNSSKESSNSSSFPVGWVIDALQPQRISASMLQRDKYNLNEISHDSAISLVKRILSRGLTIKSLYLDTVGDCAKYRMKLEKIFGGQIEEIRVEKKADSLFPIVSAASIVAKVTRDNLLESWDFPENRNNPIRQVKRNFGSGYPADPNTVKWLEDNFDKLFGFPTIVRFSWSTCDRILEQKAYKVNWEIDSPMKKKSCFLNRNGITTSKPKVKEAKSSFLL